MSDLVPVLRHMAALKSLRGWGHMAQRAMAEAADEIDLLQRMSGEKGIREMLDKLPAHRGPER